MGGLSILGGTWEPLRIHAVCQRLEELHFYEVHHSYVGQNASATLSWFVSNTAHFCVYMYTYIYIYIYRYRYRFRYRYSCIYMDLDR